MDDDIFDEVHTVDEREVQRGHEDGQRGGMVTGLLEGRQLGAQKGYEIGAELGFYAGCVRTWRALQAIEKDADNATPHRPTTSTQQAAVDASHGGQEAKSNTPAEGLDLSNLSIQSSTSRSTDSNVQEGQRHDRQETKASPQDQQTGSQQAQTSLHSRLIPERAEKSLAGLEQMLSEFPLDNPQDERLHELLDSIRGKFKAVASMLGLLSDYMPRETDKLDDAVGFPQVTSNPGTPSSKGADLSF